MLTPETPGKPALKVIPGGGGFPSEIDLAGLRADLKRAVAQTCPRWLSDRSEDIVQVALMRVMEIYRKREGNVELSSFYLRKAAYSAVVDEIRRLRRRQEVPLENESSEIVYEPVAESADPERAAAARETGRAIKDCLGRLVRPRKLAVTLSLQGHSVPEIGKLMSWSTKKAENLVYRGLSDLRGCLDSKGVGR